MKATRCFSRTLLGLIAICGTTIFAPVSAQDTAVMIKSLSQVYAAKAKLSSADMKISSSLRSFVNAQTAGARRVPARLVRVDGSGRVQVYISLHDAGPDVVAELTRKGVQIELVNSDGLLIQAWAPVEALSELAKIAAVARIRPPVYGVSLTGSVNSEGDAVLRAQEARAQFNVDGSGVRVGVISDGVDTRAEAQATADLPAAVEVNPGSVGEGDEGTAMLEIIHDLAPGAALAFSSGFPTSLQMATTMNYLASSAFNGAGCHIVVDDLGFFGEPFFEDGLLAQTADDIVAQGVTYFTAAGNQAFDHYEMTYLDQIPGEAADNVNPHDFGASGGGASDVGMSVSVPAGGSMVVVLQWNDPFGGSGNDYDLIIYDDNLNNVVARSDDAQNGFQDPIEIVEFENNNLFFSERVNIVINRVSGAETRFIEFFILSRTARADEHTVIDGSIAPGQQSSAGAVAVGAIDVADFGNDTIELFSSRGPVRKFFPTEVTLLKPDVAAVDGNLITGVGDFGSRDGFGRARFYGTSAAAPHAAAVAALLLQAEPTLDPATLESILRSHAVDLGEPGDDNTFGAGRLDAFAAVQAVSDGAPPPDRLAPHNLTASFFENAVNLQWQPPAPNGAEKLRGVMTLSALAQRGQTAGTGGANLPHAFDRSETDIQEQEPNDSPDTAQQLSGASPIRVTGSAEVDDAGVVEVQFTDGTADDLEDLFLITLAQPGLQLELAGFASDCDLYLLDSPPTQILAASNNLGSSGTEAINEPTLPAGEYLVAVSIYDLFSAGETSTPYRLTLQGDFGSGSETDLTAYRVYRSTSPGARESGSLLATVDVPAASYSDPGVAGFGTLYYQVTAVYGEDESGPSNEVEVELSTQQGAKLKVTVAESQKVGEPFWVDVAVEEVTGLFGISFDLNFSRTDVLDVGAPESDAVVPGPFLGADVVFVSNVDEASGAVSFGISRKSGQGGVDGGGVAARIKFVSQSTAPAGTELSFSLSAVAANDAGGNDIPFTPVNGSTRLEQGVVVWPGDTNNDGVVDQRDVLPLGLNWGKTGPARENATTAWVGQQASPWQPEAATHADGNGDGLVNQGDVLPVGLNWGKTHTGPTTGGRPWRMTARAGETVGLQLFLQPASTQGGGTVTGHVSVERADELFALAFELVAGANQSIVDISSGSWAADGPIFLAHNKTDGAGVALSLKAGQTASASQGIIVNFALENVVDAALPAITNVVAINRLGERLNTEISPTAFAAAIASEALPERFALFQNSPNPFNPETRIAFELAVDASVRIEVYDILGRRVRTLIDEPRSAGRHSVVWDGRSTDGEAVASGVYLYRIQTDHRVSTRKMLLVR